MNLRINDVIIFYFKAQIFPTIILRDFNNRIYLLTSKDCLWSMDYEILISDLSP